MAPHLDWTLNVGNLLSILLILGGMARWLVSMSKKGTDLVQTLRRVEAVQAKLLENLELTEKRLLDFMTESRGDRQGLHRHMDAMEKRLHQDGS